MRVRGLAGGCGSLATISDLDLGIGGNRLFKLLNIGNTNGAAAVGVLYKLSRVSDNSTFLVKGDVLASRGTIGGVVTMSPRRATMTPGLAIFRGLRLVYNMRNVRGDRDGRGVRELVRLLGLGRMGGGHTNGLSNNFTEQLDVTLTLMDRPRVLFLSRPATVLSMVTEDRL